MELNSGLFLTQRLQLNMTQDLIQAISLLQYSSLELISIFHELMEENPLIEVEIHFESLDSEEPVAKGENSSSWIEQIKGKTENTLLDAIREQIIGLPLTVTEWKIINYMIGQLDENGYLEMDEKEVAHRFKVSSSDVDRLVELLQQLDPPGVGARSVGECFLLQLRRRNEADSVAEKILKDHFQDFIAGKWQKLTKITGFSFGELESLLKKIRLLNPRPASSFHKDESIYIFPDAILEYRHHRWEVRLTDDVFTLRLNQHYQNFNGDKSVQKFYSQNLRQFQLLQNGMKRRKDLLEKLLKCLIQHQEKFLLNKTKVLAPLTLQDLAEELGVHVSTISRIVKNKYIQTPKGLFAMKDLLSDGRNKSKGGKISVHQIKQKIEEIIDNEDKQAPYSDQRIADLLNEEGLEVSRRVIAKYREQMNIPSSTKRKWMGGKS